MRVTVDNRTGVYNHETEIIPADENGALEWLSRLDGKQHTLLNLERKDGWQLMIGGGPARFVVTLGNGSENLTFHNFDGNETVLLRLCAGGQFGEFPASLCATVQQAAEVVTLFFNGSERQSNWL